jgi:hypothetical protein
MIPGMRGSRMKKVALALLLASGCAVSCVRSSYRSRKTEVAGTCEGACHHYVVCADPKNEDATYRECLGECREIFVSDGRPDADTLRDYERLECEDAVSFVEGHRKRPLTPRTGT